MMGEGDHTDQTPSPPSSMMRTKSGSIIVQVVMRDGAQYSGVVASDSGNSMDVAPILPDEVAMPRTVFD